jgi:hypothetical protein
MKTCLQLWNDSEVARSDTNVIKQNSAEDLNYSLVLHRKFVIRIKTMF